MMQSAAALKECMQSSESFSVPKDYAELEARYGPHIEKVLARENQYPENYQDLLGYVWEKLLEAKFLDRFQENMDEKVPKTLNAIQACDALGVSWQEWVAACVASHTGQRETWMPTPVNLAMFRIQGISWYDRPEALFSFAEVQALTYGEIINGKRHWAFKVAGREVRDGRLIGGYRAENIFKGTPIKPTPSEFRNYLTNSVKNRYINFCRTSKRRHKERPQNPQGDEGHLTSWEDTLVESKQPSIEVKLQLSEARTLLRTAIQACLKDMGVPSGGGDEEGRIFAQLEQGASLIQALKHCGFPTKARKSVIKSIRSRSLDDEAQDELV